MGVAQPTRGRSTNPLFCFYCIYNNAKLGVAQTNPKNVCVAQPTPTFAFIVYIITQKWGSLLGAPTPTDKPLFIFYC